MASVQTFYRLLGTALCSATLFAAELRFNRDIRPILSENCFVCHGPDKNNRKAKMRLDNRENALERGAFVPGKPDKSELVKRIFTSDPDDHMPPPDSGKKLTDAEKETLKQWIAQGAVYEPHWAYIPIKRPPLPTVQNTKWVKTPVDAFVLAPLEAKKIAPSPEADAGTLLRRIHFDLTGLPPTPEEAARFVSGGPDSSYEKVVDSLLQSPQYGVRMAVPWLDVVRFADTVGYHGDQNVRIFPYRDYVIKSFNENKPFDQFTIEQLAGDLLPNPTREQLVATGFNRLNMMTREGGAQPKEYLAKYAADRARTVSMAWLGSTMGCAECHDHKFDPFSSKDFYSLEAFFADIKQWGVYSDYGYTPNPDLKGWSNDHPFPPEMQVESPYLRHRADKLRNEFHELARSSVDSAQVQKWAGATKALLDAHPDGWIELRPEQPDADETNALRVLDDGSVLLAENGPKPRKRAKGKGQEKFGLKLPLPAGQLGMIRIELIPRPEHHDSIVRGRGESTMVTLSAAIASAKEDEKPQKLAFYYADADQKDPRYSNGFEILGIKSGWRTSKEHRGEKQTAVWLLDHPIAAAEGDMLSLDFGAASFGCVRVSVSPLETVPFLKPDFGRKLARVLDKPVGERTQAEDDLIATTCFLSTAADSKELAAFHKLHQSFLGCHDGLAWTLITQSWKPAVTRVLPRGNWQDQSGAIVQPATPHFLPHLDIPEGERATRLDLAHWLVWRENPLTARAVMNRLWKQFFGSALAKPVDDLGAQGEPPTHPELLDWLAAEFMDSGWNIKHMVKLIVLSSTYRQAINTRPELREADPLNHLLASQNPRRLEAEFVRDNALFISGLINLDLGGPSVHPYQPAGYYANLQFPDRDYYADKDDREYRRGVYIHWQRTFLQPMLANFDAPSREECTAYRNVSNTPQQALTLLNDPTFTESARVWAAHLLDQGVRSDDSRIESLYERALCREPKSQELNSLKDFLKEQRDHYHADSDEASRLLTVGNYPAPKSADAPELAAWTQVCRVILNLHETINVY